MSSSAAPHHGGVTAVYGQEHIFSCLPRLQQLADRYGQPGTMHGLNLLLGSHTHAASFPASSVSTKTLLPGDIANHLTGAVLLQEYRLLGWRTGVFATGDSFGVRTVVGPPGAQAALCLRAGQLLLSLNARLVLTTWRGEADQRYRKKDPVEPAPKRVHYATSQRMVQDTLPLGRSAEATLQQLGKRTRVHMRAARRRFDERHPMASLADATAQLAAADDAILSRLNHSALDTIDQAEFNHQVRSLCRSAGGFVLGLQLEGRWIALIGGWRQANTTWIEWQCNGSGYEKLSLGTVLRTYLLEEETRRGTTHLSFHGGTSHSMLHRFEHTPVTDLLLRRSGLLTSLLIRIAPRLGSLFPLLLQRGNFIFQALCAPGLRWSAYPPESPKP